MDVRSHERRLRRAKAQRLGTALIFTTASVVMFWLAYILFSSPDCRVGGSKLTAICVLLGGEAAAVALFSFGCVAAWLALKYGNLTTQSTRTRA